MTPRVPILLYHGIATAAPSDSFAVELEHFRSDMRDLSEAGWHCIDVEEAARLTLAGRRAPRTFSLTFDDGFRDFAEFAWPILVDLGFSATVFVVTGLIGGRADWLRDKPRELLDADEIQRLAREGVRFGSHGVTHVDLTKAAPDVRRRELEGSRARLADLTGAPVSLLAWPYGAFDDVTCRAAAAAGYELGFSVAGAGSWGRRIRAAIDPAARNALALPRREVPGGESALRRRLRMGPLDGLFVTARKSFGERGSA